MDATNIDAAFAQMMDGKRHAKVIQPAPGRPRRKADDDGDALPTSKTETFEASRSKCIAVRSRDVYRRCFSESKLRDVLPDILKDGTSYHLISAGDIDALSILRHILRSQKLDYCGLSTWCLAMPDTAALDAWTREGLIGRLDTYVGEILPNQYPVEYAALRDITRRTGGRVAVFRSHAKTIFGTGQKFSFYSEGSFNLNQNPRTEQSCTTISAEAFEFAKSYFDGIRSFIRDFDDVKPWEPTPCK